MHDAPSSSFRSGVVNVIDGDEAAWMRLESDHA
jgi:hypothetical protein